MDVTLSISGISASVILTDMNPLVSKNPITIKIYAEDRTYIVETRDIGPIINI